MNNINSVTDDRPDGIVLPTRSAFGSTARFLAAICMSSSLFTAIAQDTEEDVFELTPFEVSADDDRGYEAQNTLAGTRLNTSTKDLGTTMTILTEKFMEDLGATSTNQLIDFTPGSEKETTQQAEGAATVYWGDNPRVRGVRIENIVRNQFKTNITADSYNAGRFEFSRGGNAILFGIGNPAGSVNRYTNDAIFDNTNQYRLQLDAEGSIRHEANFNRELIDDTLAVRVALLHDRGENWIEPLFNDQERAYAAVTYKPLENLSFKFRAESYDWERSIANYGSHADAITPYLDAAAAAGETPEEHAINRNYGKWLGQVSSEFQRWGYTGNNVIALVNDAENTDGSLRNWRNKAIGAQNQVAGGKNASLSFDVVPRDFNIFGNSNFQNFSGHNYQGVVQYKVNDNIDLELAANEEQVEYDFYVNWGANRLSIDTSATLADGVTPNPNVGKYFVANDTNWRYQQERNLSNLRFTASLKYDFADASDNLAWLGKHNVAVMLENSESKNYWDSRFLANTTPFEGFAPAPRNGWNGDNIIRVINYVDLDAKKIYGPTDPREFQAYANQFDGVNAEWVPVFNSIPGNADREELDTFLGVLHSRFWNDRVVTTLGWREDSIDQWNGTIGQAEGMPNGWATLAKDVPLVKDEAKSALSPDTLSRGINFHALRGGGALSYLTFYANQSTTFNAQATTVLPNGVSAPSTTGDTVDYGIKFGLLEDKVSGVFTVFDVALENVPDVNLTWSNISQLAERVGISGFSNLNPSLTRDTRDLVSKGWEMQFTANITNNWRAMLSYDNFETEFSNVAPVTGAIFDQYGSQFLAGDTSELIEEGSTDTVQDVYDESYFAYLTEKAQEGARTLNERQNKLVFVSSYSFNEGKFKGVGVGTDIIWQDKALTGFGLKQLGNGSWVPDANNPFFGEDLLRVGAHVRYSNKIWNDRVDWTVQLNVRNIGGVDLYVVRESAVSSAPTTPIAWYTNRGEPTQYVLTNTFKW